VAEFSLGATKARLPRQLGRLPSPRPVFVGLASALSKAGTVVDATAKLERNPRRGVCAFPARHVGASTQPNRRSECGFEWKEAREA